MRSSHKKLAEKEMAVRENDIDSAERESLLGASHTTGFGPSVMAGIFGPDAPGQAPRSLNADQTLTLTSTLTKQHAGPDRPDKAQLRLTLAPHRIQAINIESRGPSPTRIKANGYSIAQTPRSATPTPPGTKSSASQREDST